MAETMEEGSGINNLVARAKEVVGAGNGDFDGQRADQCIRPTLDALNNCDAEAVLGGGLSLDPLCPYDSSRVFVVGKVADGAACTDSLECADFGYCELQNPPEDTISLAGECRASKQEGEVCSDPTGTGSGFSACSPGTVCTPNGTGDEYTCEAPDTVPNGEPCSFDDECDSGYCNLEGGGTCDERGSVSVEACDGT